MFLVLGCEGLESLRGDSMRKGERMGGGKTSFKPLCHWMDQSKEASERDSVCYDESGLFGN